MWFLRILKLIYANAIAAVAAAQLAASKVDLFNTAEREVFPPTTDRFITLTAGNPANTFGAWAEIADNTAVPLSSVFAANAGYIRQVILYTFSVPNEMHLVEFGYDGGAVVIGRTKVRSDWTYVLDLNNPQIPAGATIVYRMMAETGLATCRADFRYILG